MSFYSDLAKVTLDLLKRYGQGIIRREFVAGAYDPATGTASQSFTDTERKGALFDFGAGVTSVRGQLIQVKDKRLLVDATGAITADDNFIVGGTEYTVVTMGEISPAGTPVVYDLHIRNG